MRQLLRDCGLKTENFTTYNFYRDIPEVSIVEIGMVMQPPPANNQPFGLWTQAVDEAAFTPSSEITTSAVALPPGKETGCSRTLSTQETDDLSASADFNDAKIGGTLGLLRKTSGHIEVTVGNITEASISAQTLDNRYANSGTRAFAPDARVVTALYSAHVIVTIVSDDEKLADASVHLAATDNCALPAAIGTSPSAPPIQAAPAAAAAPTIAPAVPGATPPPAGPAAPSTAPPWTVTSCLHRSTQGSLTFDSVVPVALEALLIKLNPTTKTP